MQEQAKKGGMRFGNAIRTEVQRPWWGGSGTARLAGHARTRADHATRRGDSQLASRPQKAPDPRALWHGWCGRGLRRTLGVSVRADLLRAPPGHGRRRGHGGAGRFPGRRRHRRRLHQRRARGGNARDVGAVRGDQRGGGRQGDRRAQAVRLRDHLDQPFCGGGADATRGLRRGALRRVGGALKGNLASYREKESIVGRDDRLKELDDKYEDYAVYDNAGEKIGKVDDIFIDETDREEYIGVKMGLFGLSGKTLIPMELARVDEQERRIEVAASKDQAKDAPHYHDDDDIDHEFEAKIRDHFGLA